MRTAELFAFAHEREMVRQRRAAGLPRPWTDDPILQKYRFTNIHRENDPVTVWIRENWRQPYTDDPDLWFAMVVARHINNIPALSALPFPVPWNPIEFLEITHDRKKQGLKNFSPAYMISTNGRTAIDKTSYLCDYVFNPLWKQRETLRPRLGDTLTAYHMMLGQMYGLASFLTAQVIADIKWHGTLLQASDHYTFAASGPGSRRGLNYIMDKPMDAPWKEDDWRLTLARLHSEIEPMFMDSGIPAVDAQNLQNCLCEMFKYAKAKTGIGRPKQIFPGTAGGPLISSRQTVVI